MTDSMREWPSEKMPSDRSSMTDEQYVRSRWEQFPLERCSDELGQLDCYKVYVPAPNWLHRNTFETAIKAAADFTEQREQRIQDVVEEIELLNASIDNARQAISFSDIRKEPWIGKTKRSVIVMSRILATLEAQLAELPKGMKG